MSFGVYEEPLPCGGNLKVTSASWEISYYFPGPDLRYSGTLFSIPGSQIDSYIQAYMDNWTEYDDLQRLIPTGGEFSKEVKMGMTIRISDFNPGVCLHEYHLPVSSKPELDRLLAGFSYARTRAPVIQKFLSSI